MAPLPMRTCWMCGRTADSREHKIKKTDFVRRYGGASFKDIGGLLHVKAGVETDVQGAGASVLKYPPVICSRCNTSTSQSWDRAYEVFERAVFENETEVLRRRFILLREVFGDEDAQESCPALYKYFVKAFGCRIASSGFQVPRDLVELLPQEQFLTRLRLTFAVNNTALLAPSDIRDNFLGLGDLVRIDSKSRGLQERYYWHIQIGWLRVSFFFDLEVDEGTGAPWTADSACIYLGEIEAAPDDVLGQFDVQDDGLRARRIER